MRDEMNAVAYDNSDGNRSWRTSWVEIGESDGPSKGGVSIIPSGVLPGLTFEAPGRGVERSVDLADATDAILSFEFKRESLASEADYVSVQLSADGAASWIELARLEGPADDDAALPFVYDVGSYTSADTRIRFVAADRMSGACRGRQHRALGQQWRPGQRSQCRPDSAGLQRLPSSDRRRRDAQQWSDRRRSDDRGRRYRFLALAIAGQGHQRQRPSSRPLRRDSQRTAPG